MSTTRARTLRKSMSTPEAIVWNALRELRPLGHHFRRQVQLGTYYADFASHSLKLVIEVDGDTHGTAGAIAHDRRRDAFIAAEGYKVFRIPVEAVTNNLGGVMISVLAEVDTRVLELGLTPTLAPSPQGGGKPAGSTVPDRHARMSPNPTRTP